MRIAFVLLTTLLLVFGQINVFGQRKFELNDFDKLYTLTDPQISPDGKSILVLVSKPDTTTNKNKTFIYKVDVATRTTQQLTFDRASVSFPRWSPTGNAIAFIASDAAGKGQIFVVSINGGEAKKLLPRLPVYNNLHGVRMQALLLSCRKMKSLIKKK